MYVPPECPPKEYNGECHMNIIRKMQASFSWDWGLAAPSTGIWRDVELEYFDSAVVKDIVVNMDLVENTWVLKVFTYLQHSSAVDYLVLSVEIP